MPFQKGNNLGAKKRLKRPLNKEIIAKRGLDGHKQRLKAIPNWQEQLREYVDQLISRQNDQT